MDVTETVRRLANTWAEPRPASHRGAPTPFPLRCSAVRRADEPARRGSLPAPLADLWQHFEEVRLFEDTKYSQWGLVLFSEDEARRYTNDFRETRSKDFIEGDVVVGRFLGDSDLLVMRCNPDAGDFGHVLVALPLDPRHDWYEVAADFDDFLREYERSEGSKFWER
jgi:hypothetical protein